MEKNVKNKFKYIKLSKLKFLPTCTIDKLDKIDLHNYIERLHSLLRKQAKKLRKYKEKLNKKVKILKLKILNSICKKKAYISPVGSEK